MELTSEDKAFIVGALLLLEQQLTIAHRTAKTNGKDDLKSALDKVSELIKRLEKWQN